MPNLADFLHDESVHDTINALRYSAGLSRRVLAHLRGLQKDLLAAMAETGDLTSQHKLAGLLKEAQSAIEDRYGSAQVLFEDDAGKFINIQAVKAIDMLNSAVGVDMFTGKVSQSQADAIASDVLITGSPSREWWAAQEADTLQKFKGIVRTGMLDGSTGDQMARLVRDMMGTSMRNAEALVRTSVISLNNAAHMAAYMENEDIIEGLTWLSTLDQRTCYLCGSLDGRTWAFREPHPEPALHWNCRCMLLPLTKSWEQLAREAHGNSTLAKKLDQMDEGTRASMNGQVPKSLHYEDWLKSKPQAFQEEILGPARFRLMQSGKLTLRDLTDMRGHELTLAELASK